MQTTNACYVLALLDTALIKANFSITVSLSSLEFSAIPSGNLPHSPSLYLSFICSFRASEVVAQSCPTLCNPMDCSLPSSSVHGIFQAIVLEWIAISFSRGSSWPRDRTWVSRIVDRRFTAWATREVQWFTNINESPGKFVNVQIAGPHPQRFLILETCPWICMSNKFPRDSDAAVLGITV